MLSYKNYIEISNNGNVTHKNKLEKAKAIIRGKYIALDTLCYKMRN